MEIDNFANFPFDRSDKWCFYFFQLLDRSKNGNNKNRLVKSYYIDSQKTLEYRMEEMIKIADVTGARIYVHPARRNKRDIDLDLIAYVAQRLKESNECDKMRRAYESVCGQNKWVEKRWIVDVDHKDKSTAITAMWYISSLRPKLSVQEDMFLNQTPNWRHIICKKWFDLSQYDLQRDIHKNNPTVIYAPDPL